MDIEQIDYEEFINSMEEYVPTIPDEVITYYLNKTGFACTDIKIKRLISLATQKFISDVTNDSLQYCKIRHQAPTREKVKKDKSLVLTMEDLALSLRDYGINIKKPDYFAETIPPQPNQINTLQTPSSQSSKGDTANKDKDASNKDKDKDSANKDKDKDGTSTTSTGDSANKDGSSATGGNPPTPTTSEGTDSTSTTTTTTTKTTKKSATKEAKANGGGTKSKPKPKQP
eukprot:gene6108-7611_t